MTYILNNPLKLEVSVFTNNFFNNVACLTPVTPFVRISASCESVEIWWRVIKPYWSLSLLKWQSISMCFVLSWNVGFLEMCTGTWLSQKTCIGNEHCADNSFINLSNQTSSPTTCHIALYSASAKDKDIVACFLDFQLIGHYNKKKFWRH